MCVCVWGGGGGGGWVCVINIYIPVEPKKVLLFDQV